MHRGRTPSVLPTSTNSEYTPDEGRVVESGSYHELRSREDGEFHEMVEMQSL